MEKVGRGDKALNANRSCNGVVTARFGDKVYIKWADDAKSTRYEMRDLLWWPEGKAWSVPISTQRSENG